jgi:hypothetical protein
MTTPLGSSTAVKYIVRVERGTVNRGIYDIAVLYAALSYAEDQWFACQSHRAETSGKWHAPRNGSPPRSEVARGPDTSRDESLIRDRLQ